MNIVPSEHPINMLRTLSSDVVLSAILQSDMNDTSIVYILSSVTLNDESTVRYNPPLLLPDVDINLHPSNVSEFILIPPLDSVISKIPPAVDEDSVRVSEAKEREERQATPDVIMMIALVSDGEDEEENVMDERDVVPCELLFTKHPSVTVTVNLLIVTVLALVRSAVMMNASSVRLTGVTYVSSSSVYSSPVTLTSLLIVLARCVDVKVVLYLNKSLVGVD